MNRPKSGVKIVRSDELDLNTSQTAGVTRAARNYPCESRRPGPGRITMESWTLLYVVKGRVRMRWGDQLEFSEEARPGDFIYVPPNVPHQVINASPDEICEAVVVRNGQDPIVINLDLPTPESGSAEHPGMPFHPDRQNSISKTES